ncbi:MAG: GTP cyclohydrolase II, partial [Acidobacteriota bacterium]|nr:GTP cyclohydrolase II [Acidobacteriota bacterium]
MPKDSSSAPKLDLIPTLETVPVPFVAKADIPSLYGNFTVYGFLEKATGKEHLAIVAGDIDSRSRINV